MEVSIKSICISYERKKLVGCIEMNLGFGCETQDIWPAIEETTGLDKSGFACILPTHHY